MKKEDITTHVQTAIISSKNGLKLAQERQDGVVLNAARPQLSHVQI